MRAVCFHGRRELDMSGDFLLAAQILVAGAAEASLSAQVRTPAWPSPPGSPDRAIIRLDSSSLEDMAIPSRYDLEVVCDSTLAVIPPMGNALLPGGLLILNAPDRPVVPSSGPRIISADLSALALLRGAPLGFALSGAAWAALRLLASEMDLPPSALENASPAAMPEPPGEAARGLLLEAHQWISSLLENEGL